MQRKFLPLILILTMIFSLIGFNPVSYASVGTEFAGGSGTETDPYQIATAVQLDNVRYYVGPDYHDTYFKLIDDINLGVYPFNDGEGWLPIGGFRVSDHNYSAISFHGTFDGDNHSISGLFISTTDNTRTPGLFGVTFNATIKNLILEDVSITGPYLTGGLIGDAEHTIVTGVSVKGTINGNSSTGGLIGYTYESLIIDTSFNGSVIGGDYAGGLVGFLHRSAVRNSSSTGPIEGNFMVGGLVGYSYESSIFESYSGSSITGTIDSWYIGGLVGSNFDYSTIDKSYATGAVTGTGCVGGLVGENSSDSKATNSYATGNITSSDDSVDGFVGGLAGLNSSSTIENCYAVGTVTGPGIWYGGLVGYIDGDDYDSPILSSYSLGPSNGLGEVVTDAEMKTELTFDGWTFGTIWGIVEGVSYPTLLPSGVAKIASMKDCSSISVPYDTLLNAVDLPFMAFATLDDTTTVPLRVTWDRDGSSYDGSTPGDYTFTGTLALVGVVTNPEVLTASVTVTVLNPPKHITGVESIPDITVPLGTARYQISFPPTVVVTLDYIDTDTRELNVKWDGGVPTYDGDTAGEYVFTGEIIIGYDIINPSNLTGKVKVIVESPADAPPVIIYQPEDENVKVGESASFSVGYTAKPDPSIQWQYSKNGGKKWNNIPGANSRTYHLTQTTIDMNGYQYRVILDNGVGTVTSNSAKLTVTYGTADMQISQTLGEYDPATSEIIWRVIVYNNGTDTAQGVVIKNTLANTTKLLSVSASNNLGYSLKGKTVTINVGEMQVNREIQFEIKVLVTRVTTTIENTATVTSTSLDLDLENNTSTSEVFIQ